MANTSPINTRIILKNDELSNWNKSGLVLKPGEIALARREDGSYEMRIGQGDKTWSQLGNQNFMLSASQVIGLEDSMAQLSTSHYEVSNLDELTGTYSNGDTAVVKTSMGQDSEENDLFSYTAYVYDGSLSAWKAMDGNYNADNIYFDYNITKAGAWTGVGNVSHTANTVQTLNSSGKSLTEVMDMIFKGDESFPAKASANKPTCGITQVAKSVEVGTTVTPQFTLTFDAKKYAYGSNTNTALNSTTGASAKTYTLKYTDNAGAEKTLTGNYAGIINASETYNAKAGTNNGTAYLSVDYAAAADGTYIPRSNLERVLSSATELATYRTAAGQATASNANNKIVGYYPNFYGFKNASGMLDLASIDSAKLRALTNQTASPNASTGKINPLGTASVTYAWRQFFYALPAGLKSSLAAVDKNGLPLTMKKLDYAVTVTHANGVTSSYDVFYTQQDADYGATTLTLTWA